MPDSHPYYNHITYRQKKKQSLPIKNEIALFSIQFIILM